MPPDALLPPEQFTPPQSPEMEALLVQQERQHDEMMGSMDVLIQQTAKNDPEPFMDTLIQQTDETKSAIIASSEAISKTVESVKPEITEAIQAALTGIEIAKKMKIEKGDKGDKGEKGDTGEKGEKGDRGESGEDGAPGMDGEKGENGKDGAPGRDGLDGMTGEKGEKGDNGKDGSPDTGVDIVKKISALEGLERLSYKVLRDLPTIWKEQAGGDSPRGAHVGSRSYAFTELTDTPKSYASQAGKWLRVNLAGDAIEFINSGVTKLIAGTNVTLSPTTGLGDVTVNVPNAFVQGGNSFGTTATIGTNDNQPLAFEVNNVEKMRLLANGRLGIGTDTPSSLLDVRGLVLSEINSLTVPGFGFSNAMSAGVPTYGVGYISGNLMFIAGSVPACVITPVSQNYRLPSQWTYSWSANTGNDAFPDLGLSRISAGRLAVGNGSAANTSATVVAARFQPAQGASVAAANNLTLGSDGSIFIITGNTQINAITIAGWNAGSTVKLYFTGTPTVKHGVAGGAGTATIVLSGGVDFTASNPSILTLEYVNGAWYESARTINHA